MKRLILSFILLIPASAPAQELQPVRIAVTTTLIETAVRDLLNDQADIVRVLPPGSCPGHFDLEPGQVTDLLSARVFIRHDYQTEWDRTLIQSGCASNRIIGIASQPAFTIPAGYVRLCEDLARAFAHALPETDEMVRSQLPAIRARAERTAAAALTRARSLSGKKVLCARYQKDFCEWMGLKTVAVFQAGTDESAWQLNRAVDMARTAGAVAVIGNLQWGPKHLSALVEATGLPGVMLSNFPETGETGAYWILVEQNVHTLEKGLP